MYLTEMIAFVKKSQKLFVCIMICVFILITCGIISYIDFTEWSGGYIFVFICLPLMVLFGIIAIILLILFMKTSHKERELEIFGKPVVGEKLVVGEKSREILTWLIICVVIGIVFGILASLDLWGWITGGYMVFIGFPIAIIFGLISLILFFRWSLRRREEDVKHVIENELQEEVS